MARLFQGPANGDNKAPVSLLIGPIHIRVQRPIRGEASLHRRTATQRLLDVGLGAGLIDASSELCRRRPLFSVPALLCRRRGWRVADGGLS